MFYVKESIRVGENRFWERAIRRSPLKSLDSAKVLCDRSCKEDNQPFVIDVHGTVIHTGKKGKDYGDK